ncbi:MAG TPA: hypothetical protein VFJ02_20175, partial [Vicinamibacterales bacterium]|nr:hypothetical protein [Vicinamibacterales bacterium]
MAVIVKIGLRAKSRKAKRTSEAADMPELEHRREQIVSARPAPNKFKLWKVDTGLPVRIDWRAAFARSHQRGDLMKNVWAIALALAGVTAGYALSGTPTEAQSAGDVPFTVGDRVTLTFDYASQSSWSTIDCTVAEFRSGFVRCVPADGFRTGRNETWYSLRQV